MHCTGLAVVRLVSASAAHNTYAGAHAGRRKIIGAEGEGLLRHKCMLTTAAWRCQAVEWIHFNMTQDLNAPNYPVIHARARPTALPRVAFQGVPGAFSEIAIKTRWPEGAIPLPADTFVDALRHVRCGRADFAAIPVENVIAGPVHAAVEALNAAPVLRVHGEVRIPIDLCLMAKADATLEGVRVVHSHQMAIAQSGTFFAAHPWMTPQVHGDTAGAAHDVSQQHELTVAAIASAAAATRYGLTILAHSIQDDPNNWTRFVIVSTHG